MSPAKRYHYHQGREYDDDILGDEYKIGQHYRTHKTTEAERRAEDAESGQFVSRAMKERDKVRDMMNKATMDERKLRDQRLDYKTAEKVLKDRRRDMTDYIKKSRHERGFDRNFQTAEKSKRDWKNHKYVAKVKTEDGKIRYIYEDDQKKKSNGSELPRYNEQKWTDNDRRRIENETGRDMSNIAKRENAELDRKTKRTRDERKHHNSQPSNAATKSKSDGSTIFNYAEGKISEADRKKWNASVASNKKQSRDERKTTGENVQDSSHRMSSTRRKNVNAELDRKTKLSRDERKYQNSQSNKKDQNGQSSNDNSRIKRDEVNEDTRKGNKRAAVNTNSYAAGQTYTNNYVRRYGDVSVNSL